MVLLQNLWSLFYNLSLYLKIVAAFCGHYINHTCYLLRVYWAFIVHMKLWKFAFHQHYKIYSHNYTNITYRLSIQSAFGYRLRKNPLLNLQSQTRLWNYDNFSTIQWKPHLIWPCSDKEIWIFVKQVIGPFLPSFVTWMYVAFTGRLCSQKTGLQTYSHFMHTFLSITRVVPDNPKACQICKIM